MEQNKILEGVDAILGEGGIAFRNGALRFNPQQHDYARHAALGYCRQSAEHNGAAINILQAATGLGKTLGYLVPAMLYAAYTGKRVAVSTFTRHLQQQILNKDAERAAQWVREHTGIDLSIARRVGKGNYVSSSNCQTLIDRLAAEDAKRFAESIFLLEDLIEWNADENASGLFEEFLDYRCLDVLPEGVLRDEICLNSSSSAQECERYQADIAKGKQADVLIVNHALMVMHALRWTALLDEKDGRPIALVIFDEADRLPDAAESILCSNVSLHKLLNISEQAATAFNLPQVVAPVKALHELAMSQAAKGLRFAAIKDANQFGAILTGAASILSKAAGLLAQNNDLFSDATAKNASIAAEFIDAANNILRVNEAMHSESNSAMLSWSPIRSFPSLLIGNPNAGNVLSRLWSLLDRQGNDDTDEIHPPRSYLDAVLFTSATLATPGRVFPEAFDEFAQSVGVVRHRSRATGALIHNVCTDLFKRYQPAKFGTMQFVLADPATPSPSVTDEGEEGFVYSSNPDWLAYCARMIRAAQERGGRTIVLTLSWRDTLALADLLAGMDDLLIHRRGDPLRGVLAEYRRRPHAVLISPGAWEGIDEPGLVNNVVVTRIPFLSQQRLERERMAFHLSTQNLSPDRIRRILGSIDASSTRRKLEQGFGRGIRSALDNTVLWIADPRFPLPESFASSLDPVILAAPQRYQHTPLRHCIPQRFRETTYEEAKILLADGTLHTVI